MLLPRLLLGKNSYQQVTNMIFIRNPLEWDDQSPNEDFGPDMSRDSIWSCTTISKTGSFPRRVLASMCHVAWWWTWTLGWKLGVGMAERSWLDLDTAYWNLCSTGNRQCKCKCAQLQSDMPAHWILYTSDILHIAILWPLLPDVTVDIMLTRVPFQTSNWIFLTYCVKCAGVNTVDLE